MSELTSIGLKVKNRQTGEMEDVTLDAETNGLEITVRGNSPKLLASAEVGTSAASVYQAGGDLRHVVIMVCNTSASDATVKVYLLPDGESVADAYALTGSYTVPANSSAESIIPFGISLEEGDDIQMVSGTDSVITATVFGEPQ